MAIELPDISPFKKRIEEIDELMNQPDFFNDARRSASLSREQLKLRQLIEDYEALGGAKSVAEHRELLEDDEGDEELKELAHEELPELEAEIERLEQKILVSMILRRIRIRVTRLWKFGLVPGEMRPSICGDLLDVWQVGWRARLGAEQPSSSESGISGFKSGL